MTISVVVCIMLSIFSIFELWMAAARGAVHNRWGGVFTRKDVPVWFWIFVSFHVFCVFIYFYVLVRVIIWLVGGHKF